MLDLILKNLNKSIASGKGIVIVRPKEVCKLVEALVDLGIMKAQLLAFAFLAVVHEVAAFKEGEPEWTSLIHGGPCSSLRGARAPTPPPSPIPGQNFYRLLDRV